MAFAGERDAAMECRCYTVEELYGDEAEDYVAEHLTPEEPGADTVEQRYRCPETGRTWELDYPDGRTGQARIRLARA